MASNAIPTQGIKVLVGDGAEPEIFTEIAEVSGFDGPSTSANEIEVTTLASTAKEFIAGLSDNGELSLTVNAVPSDAQQVQIRADLTAGTKRNYQIDFNDGDLTGTLYTFEAFVKDFPFSASADDKLTGTITLRITGPITITPLT